MKLPLQLHIWRLWIAARQRLIQLGRRLRTEFEGPRLQGDHGEMTAGVILLVVLAVAAITIGAIIVAKLNSQTAKIPG
ncbi:MAG: hypothetical protein H0V69_10180 [Acidimicrobiia bacterium]|jgi:hypothetical protein|nr:hypothetical protein [Acidimicrobiia bacterium]